MNFITTSQAQGRVPITILHLHDRINLGNVKELDHAARGAFAQGVQDLLIDLTEAPSVTSAGLSAIISIYKMLGRDDLPEGASPEAVSETPWKSTHLKLYNPSTYVREVLTMAGLSEYIEMYDNLQEAVASF